MTNKKSILFVVMFIVLCVSISSISAANTNEIISEDTNNDLHSITDNNDIQETNKPVSIINSNDDKTIPETNKISKKVESNELSGKTIVINNATFNDYFENTYLNDKVSDGDTLDFQGLINGSEYRMNINKSVNIISSTHNSLISLNTTATSLFGDEDVVSFTMLEGASNSNMTGINFYNTQIFVRHAHDIKITNITAKVEEQQVGSGVGQTSIRDNSTRIIIENNTFSTQNNGGSSTLVLAWANNCTIRNNNITGIGRVGNLIYLTTYNVDGINELETVNDFNIIENNLLTGPATPESICYGIAISGKNNTVVNNTIHYNGTGITTQWVTDERALSINTLIANNTLDGCSLYTHVNSTVYGNTVSGTNGVLMLNPSAKIYNNTVNTVILHSNDILSNNIIKSNIAIGELIHDVTITNCTIEGDITTGDIRTISNIPLNVTITNNDIKGAIVLNTGYNFTVTNNTLDKNITILGRRNTTQNLTIENNTIITDEEYAININTLTTPNLNITKNILISKDNSADDAVHVSRQVDGIFISNNYPTEAVITVDDASGTINKDILITAIVKDTENNDITEGVVTFYDVNDNIIDSSEVLNGIATVSLKFDSAQKIDLKAVYTSTSKKYFDATTTNIITIKKADVNIIFDFDSLTADKNNTLKVKVVDEDNNNIDSGKIIFKINGKTLKDENGKIIYAKIVDGKANVDYIINQTLVDKTIKITAQYSGNNNYNSVSVDQSITVSNKNINLVVEDIPETKLKSTVNINVNITEDSAPINTGKVVVKVNGKTLKDENGKVIYASIVDGKVSFNYDTSSLKVGTYTVSIIYTNSNKQIITNSTLTITN